MENLTDALRTDPVFLKAAGKYNQDPETYWNTLSPQAKAMHVNRMAATPPVLDTKPAPTSMEEMNYEDFLNLSQEQGGVPAGAEFPALNSAMETGEELQAVDTELQRRQTESMAAIDEGLLTENAQAGDPTSMTELQRRIEGRKTAPSQIGQNPPIEGILSGTVGYQPPTRDPNDPRGPAQIPPPVLSDRMNDPRGVHQIPMPSGSPVLSNPDLMDPRGPHQIPKNPTMPVLTDPTKQGTTSGILSTTVGTGPQRNNGNARGSNMAFNKIGSGEDRTAYANTPTGEMLMRVGGKIAAGSANGYNSAMNDGIQEYGAIKDGDRATDTEAYLEQVRQQEVADEAAADLAGTGTGMSSDMAQKYGKATLSAIDRTFKLLDNESWKIWDNTTGLIGSVMKNIPSSAAGDVAANIKTIEAAIGFDRLQAMRDASPTGGALGQVSNIELDLLKSSVAALNQSQSRGQFIENLEIVKAQYMEVVHGRNGSSNNSSLSEADLEYLK